MIASNSTTARTSLFSNSWRAPGYLPRLLSQVFALVVFVSPVFRAGAGIATVVDTETIAAEADSTVDALVPFPFQGLNPALAVGYDPSFGATSRSYIRFPLNDRVNEENPGLIPGARIVSARLSLTATFAVGSTQVFVYRSDVTDWPENGVNFGNQPGFSGSSLGSAVVSGAGPGQQSITIPLSGWDARSDRQSPDKKVTFVLKAAETSATGTVNFSSIQGGAGPTLVLDMRVRGQISNGAFDNGFEGFNTAGSASIVPDPAEPENNVAQLTTTSAALISTDVDTPNSPYVISFLSRFLTTSGTLSIFDQNAGLIGTLEAPTDDPDDGFRFNQVTVSDRSARNQNDVGLTFRLDGPAGSRVLLDGLEMLSMPEPTLSIVPEESGENVVVSYFTERGGVYYHLERSTDLLSWTQHGRWINGLDLNYEETIPFDPANKHEYFRLAISVDDYSSQLEIPNHHFEDPDLADNQNVNVIPEWTTTSGAGAWNPPASAYPEEAPEGDNIAFANNGHSLRQTLDTLLEPHYLYSLVVDVGKRPDIGFPDTSPPNIELRVGGISLAPALVYEESPIPAVGEFESWARDYIIGPEHPLIGQPIEIVLDGGVSQGVVSQVNFENVVLFVE